MTISTSAMTEPAEPQGIWIYAVAEQVPAGCLTQVTGVSGEPVRTVAAAGLTAIAGDVLLAEYGEAALRRNFEDLEWLDRTARAHHRVIDAVSQHGPVVPMRLATVYRDDPNLAAALAERGEAFRTALARTAGRSEWGVKIYSARLGAQAARPAEAADPAEATDPAPGEAGRERARSGADYLRRKRQELNSRQDARRHSLASVEAIHAALCRLCVGARLHPPQSPELAGVSSPMLLNGAYLLDADHGDEFAAAVTVLASQYQDIEVELTGPWPPYSFAGMDPSDDA